MDIKDNKPLRQEDYQAMAEELRRVQEENEQLKAGVPPKKKHMQVLYLAMANTLIACFLLLAGFASIVNDHYTFAGIDFALSAFNFFMAFINYSKWNDLNV